MRGVFRGPTFIAIMLFSAGLLPPMATLAVPRASGDWDITSDTVIENETVSIDGNINIINGSHLTIINSNMRFNVQFRQQVYVDEGAALTVISSNITGDINEPEYHGIQIAGNCTISCSNITGCYLNSEETGRVELEAVVILMSSCTSWGGILSADGCSFIINYSYDVWGGNVTLSRSFFLHPGQDKVPLPADAGPVPLTPPNGMTVFNCAFRNASNAAFLEGGQGSMFYPLISYENSPIGTLTIDRCSFASTREAIILWDQPLPVGGIALLNNSFIECSAAAVLRTNASRFCNNSVLDCTNGLWANGLTNGTISNNLIINCTSGILLDRTSRIEVSDNRISNCTTGIYCGMTYGTAIRRNVIENCSAGINWTSQPPRDPGLVVTGNSISDCGAGMTVKACGGEISNNTIADCKDGGLELALGDQYAMPVSVRYNSFVRCGTGGPNATALNATIIGYTHLELSGNSFRDDPFTAVTVTGPSEIEDNVINGSRMGMVLNYWQGDISTTLAHNEINVSTTAIWCWNLAYRYQYFRIEENRISSSGDGVVLVGTRADVVDNSFQNITGFCVRSIGYEQPPGNNSYPSACAGRFRQEWYFSSRVWDESGGKVGGANVSCRDVTGAMAAELVTDEYGYALCSLGQYMISAAGNMVKLDPYCVTAAKPSVGIARASVTMERNEQLDMVLHPLSDLFVRSLAYPEGRLQPGVLVLITASIGLDTTYNSQPVGYDTVQVLFQVDGLSLSLSTLSVPRYPVDFPVFLWPESGNHTLRVIIDPIGLLSEAFEDNNELTVDLSVNYAPIAILEVSSTSALVGDGLQFRSNGSWDDRNISKYLFDFGDGEDSGWTNSSSAMHAYVRSGTYSATLEVMDDEGQLSEWSEPISIWIRSRPLNVTVFADKPCVRTLEPVMFWATVSDPEIDLSSYRWDFGDGEQGYSRTFDRIFHSYGSSGEYIVKVTVTDDELRTATDTISITVQNQRPTTSIQCFPTELTVLTAATFVSDPHDADGYILEWRWDFGDGECSTAASVTHTYPRKGNFTVTHLVRDDSGDWSEPCNLVVRVRNMAPLAHARASAVKVRPGGTVSLNAGATTDPDDGFDSLVFLWRSSDGWKAVGPNVTRRFDKAGIYYFCVTVRDPELAETTTGLVVTVEEGPAPAIGVSPLASVAAVAVLLATGALILYGLRRRRVHARRGMPPRLGRSFPPPPPRGRP